LAAGPQRRPLGRLAQEQRPQAGGHGALVRQARRRLGRHL
ncbi:hypothetical protein BN1708_020373, partial [Verticillium longisporum]